MHIAPVDPGDAVRARVPGVLLSHTENVAAALADGLVERALKERCARFLATGEPLAVAALRCTARERAALAWAAAIAAGGDGDDSGLWDALHRHFTDAQLVELGYAIAYAFGQQRWLATLDL
jgi:alkylhydroperoxidase family enzyme